jgi:RNase H-like domain found in reverse transcriptase/Reverse transcriptase (RNA-dependent DNA polymerase)/Integrase zinc binding domain/Chromo (CHRromatin Organisation MOdifier) domain/Aspartyl protease
MSTTTVPALPGLAALTTFIGGKDAPILEKGNLTPSIFDEFKTAATSFFRKAKITDDHEKVLVLLNSFRDPRVDSYIKNNKTRIHTAEYVFDNLLSDLRKRFLPPTWAMDLYRQTVNSKMVSNESFEDFCTRVVAANNLLEGDPLHLSHDSLRKTIEGNMSQYLADAIAVLSTEERQKIEGHTDFYEWEADILRVDRRFRSHVNYVQDINNSAKRQADSDTEYGLKRQRYSDRTPPSSHPATGANAIPNKENSFQQQASSFRVPCPKLTDDERSLLNQYSGCRKCRQLFVNHKAGNCPNGFPDGKSYRPLTRDYALSLAAKKAIAATYNDNLASSSSASSYPPTSSQTSASHTPVAAAMPFISNAASEYVFNPPLLIPSDPSAFIQELNDNFNTNVENPVTAIIASLPSSEINFALSPESDAGSIQSAPVSNPNTQYPVIAPVSVEHLRWKAAVYGKNDFPVPFNCLLDNGAHLVLIRPEVVKSLGLKIHKLKNPELVSLALKQNTGATAFKDYVTISLSSLNNAWSSLPVCAILAPDLCTDILLGLPFLSHNKILIDHELRTAVHKPSGFDLLNENALPRKPPPKLSPHARRKLLFNQRKLFLNELKITCDERRRYLDDNKLFETIKPINAISAIKDRITFLASTKRLTALESSIKNDFKKLFEPIPHVNELPTDVTARINLKNSYDTIKNRTYTCPRQYKDAFAKLIQMRLDSGFIRPSSSPYASPSFIIPKKDPTALPRWVCDYRQLNSNTVPDSFPLPRIDDILADCARGKIWATIDMTDSFFQTRMHPEDIHKTAVSTPFGLYEWTVMPMGFRNSPAIHQRRVTNTLRPLIGKICHIYLDDIVIWSETIDEHIKNTRTVMQALLDAKLYVNEKKTHLFCPSINFLGHRISQSGIEADNSKVSRILEWPAPTSATEVRQFLGLVRYLGAFLPKIANHTAILNKLTGKEAEQSFPIWSQAHQHAFESIKNIVCSRECLTVIDHSKLDKNKIFVTTDASDKITGAVLSFGETWETARPVAFDSMPLKDAELNYAVHEKELLAVLRALRKWKTDLIGCPFYVYTDHKTLLNFHTQRDMSRRQARWMEELSIFDCKFIYVKGEANSVADSLSRFPFSFPPTSDIAANFASHPYLSPPYLSSSTPLLERTLDSPLSCIASLTSSPPVTPPSIVSASYQVEIDKTIVQKIINGYTTDPWCIKLLSASAGMPNLTLVDGLWFLDDRLIIPNNTEVREHIFRLAHDTLGHSGFRKTYDIIRNSYFWPNMRKDLQEGYIPSCVDCQHNKNLNTRPAGPLHPLPVPDQRCDTVALDFIGPLPLDEGHDSILTITDKLGSDIRIIPTTTSLTAESLALLFFDHWYCENGLPLVLISDRDKLFISRFWKHFTLLSGVKHKCSSSYHPQTDGQSERTNRTVIQAIRYHVERNQSGWKRALPRIRFNIMSTLNQSTGFSPFQLRFGRTPRVIPPLVNPPPISASEHNIAQRIIEQLHLDVEEAKDNLRTAKINQSFYANQHRNTSPEYKEGDLVMLSTLNRRREYKNGDDSRVAKFMPRYDGPYVITGTNNNASTVTLEIPNQPNIFPTFHTSLIKPFFDNNDLKFPARSLEKPGPIIVNGTEEYFVDRILDHKKIGKGYRYLVRWRGYGPGEDRWIRGADLDENSALDDYWDARNATS